MYKNNYYNKNSNFSKYTKMYRQREKTTETNKIEQRKHI